MREEWVTLYETAKAVTRPREISAHRYFLCSRRTSEGGK